jgi:hypothetical protein
VTDLQKLNSNAEFAKAVGYLSKKSTLPLMCAHAHIDHIKGLDSALVEKHWTSFVQVFGACHAFPSTSFIDKTSRIVHLDGVTIVARDGPKEISGFETQDRKVFGVRNSKSRHRKHPDGLIAPFAIDETSDLKEANMQLRQQIELQRTQIIEARIAANHEKRRSQQLAEEVEANRRTIDVMLDRLNERKKDDLLQNQILAHDSKQLRMTETYYGIVEHAHEDEVTVVYKKDDDIVEHLYVRNQFEEGRWPKIGDRLMLTVRVVDVDPTAPFISPVNNAFRPIKTTSPPEDF